MMNGLGTFAGLSIVFDMNALKETSVRNFPASKNRSKRIHKKLVKRFGGEFRKVPAIFKMGNTVFMHPSIRAELEHQVALANNQSVLP